MTRVLYISYDGMTDALGQSQVIPYLEGLSQSGFEIHLLSCEKPERFRENFSEINEKLQKSQIAWHPVTYTSKPPILSTLKDIKKLRKEAENLNKKHHFNIVHCRSYIASLIGLRLKKKENIPFLFDMRGFWADERIDGKIWDLKNPLYFLIYTYFKRKEKEFMNHADHIVTLTHKAKTEISENFGLYHNVAITVIPCCVDNALFCSDNITESDKNAWFEKLGIKQGAFVLSYSGSVGTWYMLDEMLVFFQILLESYPEAKFLFITPDAPASIFSMAEKKNIAVEKIIVYKAKRQEMPQLLSLSTLALFFIKPLYSKQASSPTKMGELMSLGIPFITNSGVGDIDLLVQEHEIGIAIAKQSENSYRDAIRSIPSLLEKGTETYKKLAKTNYSLDFGVSQYLKIYNELKQISKP